MRYELTDHEWAAIKPMLPNKPRGIPRVNDRRVLNGVFWVLRSGAPWRDRPQKFGSYTTCLPATWSSGSSTKSSTVGAWQPATTSSRLITLHSSSLRQYGYGCALMNSRPSSVMGPVMSSLPE
jgi:transposase